MAQLSAKLVSIFDDGNGNDLEAWLDVTGKEVHMIDINGVDRFFISYQDYLAIKVWLNL